MSYKKTFETANYRVNMYVTSDQVIDREKDWIDVAVHLNNGKSYYPSFFTLEKIHEIMERDRKDGDSLRGLYFWAADQIIIEKMSIENILTTIEHLYNTNALDWMFCNTKVTDDAANT